MADVTSSQGPQKLDLGTSLVGLADTGLKGYFTLQTTKELAKAPPANTAIIVGGVVVVALLFIVMLKK